MGMHASGEVLYGLDLGSMEDDDWQPIGPDWFHEDWGDWRGKLAETRGLTPVPWPGDAPRVDGRLDDTHPDVIAWRAYQDVVNRAVRECPVELDTYGHHEGDLAWVVVVKASVKRSNYDAVPLTFDHAPTVISDWSAAALTFCNDLGLPVPDGAAPGWLLTTSYG